MERNHLRLKTVVIVMVVALLSACRSPATPASSERRADTDTADPEDNAPEKDIAGSGYW